MTQKRDPDIMAIDHAIQALKKSTPHMLQSNLAFVVGSIESYIKSLEERVAKVRGG